MVETQRGENVCGARSSLLPTLQKIERIYHEMGVCLPEGAVVGCDDESDSALHCSRLKEDILLCGRDA